MSDVKIQVARLVEPGKPLEVGTAAKPKPGPRDVLVQVAACNFVPNTKNVFNGGQGLPLQEMPAIVGLDVSGVIESVGSQVHHLRAGDRVYINPSLSCETCHHCRKGRRDLCPASSLRGYFAINEEGRDLLNMHPYGGLSQYVVAPDSKVAVLPDSIDLHSAARLGYSGTSYAALKKAGVQAGSTVLINGVTGTLGVSAVAIALGMGATKILGIGRNPERLAKVEALSPKETERVATFRSTEDKSDDDAAAWVKEQTAGLGVDAFIDCLGVGGAASTTEAFVRSAIKVGGKAVLVAGGAQGDIKQSYWDWFMRDVTLVGSNWFTDGEIDELIALIGAGVVDLSWLENQTFPLEEVNEALDAASDRPGGFVNVVVIPDGAPKKD